MKYIKENKYFCLALLPIIIHSVIFVKWLAEDGFLGYLFKEPQEVMLMVLILSIPFFVLIGWIRTVTSLLKRYDLLIPQIIFSIFLCASMIVIQPQGEYALIAWFFIYDLINAFISAIALAVTLIIFFITKLFIKYFNRKHLN